MLADLRTLEALDFAGVVERVVGATRSQRGRAWAARLTPGTDFEAVRNAQQQTSAARDAVAASDLHAGAAIDTAELTQTASLGRTLAAGELRAIADALASAAAAANAAREHEALRSVCQPYVPLRDVQRAIGDAIDDRGNVVDRASPALGRIRRSLIQAQNDARDRVGAVLRSSRYAKAIQDHVVTMRDGRFVVPIKAEFGGEFPGIVHDTSASGQTLFVEPLSTLDVNNRVRTLRIDEEREVARVLAELSRRVGSDAAAIERNVDVLAALDVLVAKAGVAQAMDAIEPELSDAPEVVIRDGRHPLLAQRAVPQSPSLDDATPVLVISGPNMGGKTVALKMVGLFVAMAYCGMQLPAAGGTRIGRFERMLADIGDDQSIVANASTFSAHLQRMREMLDGADGRTLVIVDEIGGGTEPSAGAALAVAMLERILASGARAVVTTHATELKLFAHATPGVSNASVRFDPKTFRPTFHLDVGAPGQSLAFPLAQTIGIPAEIVERAQHLLDSRERDYESALAELALRAAELQAERDALEAQRRAARRETDGLERERAQLQAQRRTFADRAEERLAQSLRDFAGELQRRAAAADLQRGGGAPTRAKVTPSQAALLSGTIAAMHRDLGIESERPESADDGSFAPGDDVDVISLRQTGTVAEDYGDTLLIAMGPLKTVVKKTDVRRTAAALSRTGGTSAGRPKGAAPGRRAEGSGRIEAVARSTAELDVRGKRFVEAEPIVERWIDDSLLAGAATLRLIHGKGTGMLGRGLQEYLRSHPAVQDVRYGNEEEGSAGVTIITLTP